MSSDLVLSLCDLSCNQVRPWAMAGYMCICVDLAAVESTETVGYGSIVRVRADVKSYLPPNEKYAAVFAAPPCTDLAVSGARWMAAKGLRSLIEALEVVEACRNICEWSGARWMLENPVSTIATYWRKPNYTFNPNEYAGYLADPSDDAYTKKTCLWTGGGFVMPDKKPVPPVLGSKMHKMAPSADRAEKRSETPMGFSRAVYEYNAR